jgi:hypothetical protein
MVKCLSRLLRAIAATGLGIAIVMPLILNSGTRVDARDYSSESSRFCRKNILVTNDLRRSHCLKQ